jgi:uncharacterized protein YkwD
VKRKLILLFVAALVVAGSADARHSGTRAPTPSRVAGIPALQDQVLAAINDLRRANGLGELTLNPALSLAALGHSQSMAVHGYFAHDGWNGSPFWKRIRPNYRPQAGNRWGVAENLIWSSPVLSADDAIKLWMDSPPHRKNLLTPGWREVGLGAVRALGAPGVYRGLDVTILTADFGVR